MIILLIILVMTINNNVILMCVLLMIWRIDINDIDTMKWYYCVWQWQWWNG